MRHLSRRSQGGIAQNEHYCERCLPFAEEFRKGRYEIGSEALQYAEKRLEQFRNKFLRT